MAYQPLPPVGQDDMAGSLPVVIASDQSAVAVSGTVTANIGTVATLATAAKQDTIIGHVDGVETALGTANTSLDNIEAGYAAEGAALGSGVLLQGDDGTDRKNINVDATTGDVQVDVTNTVTVDGSGVTQPVSGTVTAELSATDNEVLDDIASAVQTEDAAHTTGDNGVFLLAVRNDGGSGLTSQDGDYSPIAVASDGSVMVTANSDIPITLDGESVTVTGTVAVTGVATAANQTTIIGHIDGVETLIGTTNTNTGNAATSLAVMDDWDNGASDGASVSGDVAHDTADAGEPVKLGAKAETALSGITLVADADRTNLYASEDGVLYTRAVPAHPSDYIDATPTTITSSTSDTSVVASGGAGVRVYITGGVITNSSTTDTRVSLKDGSGGTVKAIMPAAKNYGGVSFKFDPPLRGTANTAWHAACANSVDSVYVTLVGYKSKV